jgi:hypothetical protein
MPTHAEPFIPFHIEHVIAQQHPGDGALENLALACGRCNALKGSNMLNVDTVSKAIVQLYHPRFDVWNEHFFMDDGIIIGRTARG